MSSQSQTQTQTQTQSHHHTHHGPTHGHGHGHGVNHLARRASVASSPYTIPARTHRNSISSAQNSYSQSPSMSYQQLRRDSSAIDDSEPSASLPSHNIPLQPHATKTTQPQPQPQAHSHNHATQNIQLSSSVPVLSREFVVRRISEGESGRLKEELKCEACGKGYKHISSLAKHLWEHTPEWNVTKKLLISKHQQVQLLEAASILVSMNDINPNIPDTITEEDVVDSKITFNEVKYRESSTDSVSQNEQYSIHNSSLSSLDTSPPLANAPLVAPLSKKVNRTNSISFQTSSSLLNNTSGVHIKPSNGFLDIPKGKASPNSESDEEDDGFDDDSDNGNVIDEGVFGNME
ncbi:hypothetical protein WICPIJ_002710 [Wickerhamomyces pijperi]|uniref:C2H2-type domain-containing protein n=1 Tax=Wickerhamomyces pijperi TaxID=599730 RepID=A0A9P8Q8Q4_WICPI|nr:hypothetical protein WICPIJ_002710 [Wickerhamomyces pijperi]